MTLHTLHARRRPRESAPAADRARFPLVRLRCGSLVELLACVGRHLLVRHAAGRTRWVPATAAFGAHAPCSTV